ncbi:MAG: hypothetical protein ACYST9_03510 [Planctomycetota bacterium]|jgi:hypothetical protein
MLGIFLIICLAIYSFIELKAYSLLKDDFTEPVEIDITGHSYNTCYDAAVLHAISTMIILLGYIGSAWPYLFVEEVERVAYFIGIAFFGLLPLLLFPFISYSIIKNGKAYIRISTDEIEYKRRKFFPSK